MSIDYAKALSPYDNKGKLGLPEKFDSEEILEEKCAELARLLKCSKFCAVITGAGISTASGIPDFRGPNGVWTLERDNLEAKSTVKFENAKPTFAHFALNSLENEGIVKFLITQNVDGLHAISGFPMNRMAEMHGNVFMEKCDRCSRKYFRPFPIPSIGLKHTGRHCEGSEIRRRCRGKLLDTTLDWEDPLPEPEYQNSQLFIRKCDLVLCLGTTLQINPVGNMPLICKRNGGKLVTVNLQRTKHEGKADLVVNGKLDEVFRRVMAKLEIEVEMGEMMASESPKLVWESKHPLEIEIGQQLKKKGNATRKRKAEEEPNKIEENESKNEAKIGNNPPADECNIPI